MISRVTKIMQNRFDHLKSHVYRLFAKRWVTDRSPFNDEANTSFCGGPVVVEVRSAEGEAA